MDGRMVMLTGWAGSHGTHPKEGKGADRMNIVLTDEVLSGLEDLGVTQEDVGEAVEYAESVQKLFDDDGNNLGKKRLESMTVYAEYTVDGDTATVTRVYKHRVSLEEDN